MSQLFLAIGISKQAFYQKNIRDMKKQSYYLQILYMVEQIRLDHPTMGCRDMYSKLSGLCIGRDKFEQLCKDYNLIAERIVDKRKTTDSRGVYRFVNLLLDQEVVVINQVWQSDISYFEVAGRFYYLTFIIDGYSRRVIGHAVSKRLTTEETTLPALKMAKRLRDKQGLSYKKTIFHSDGGGQYFDRNFLALTAKMKLRNSMCEYAWENGKAERLNGVIKNNYLKHRTIKNFKDLAKEVDRTVSLYNTQKPHIALNRKTPYDVETEYLSSITNQKTFVNS